MKDSDKLRFEIGEAFNKLPKSKLDEYEERYEEILDEKEEEYGYSGDSPYYDAVEEFMDFISDENLDEENFIQVILNHNDWSTFGWALDQLYQNDSEIYDYAYSYIRNYLEQEEDDKEYIEDILTWTELPA